MIPLPSGLLVLLFSCTLADVYSPGTPGAPWSSATQKAVKAKLYRIFSPHQSLALYKDLHPEAEEITDTTITIDGVLQKWESMPNSAKALRLGFHGCFPKLDSDGNIEAACNGCLNTKGMYIRFDIHNKEKAGKCGYDTSPVAHHNGLGPTLEILEKIYKDPTFPSNTPELDISLFNQGISRADFWAFATISAVEYGIDMNNIMCDDPNHLSALDLDNYPYDSGTSSSHYHYNIHYGEVECKIPKQTFKFTTGRSDCIPPQDPGLPAYHTDSKEIAPDAQGNGASTVQYFKDNFGLNGQETVALMGSHTLGMFHFPHTVMHYTWTSRGIELFNNDYYKILSQNAGYIYNAYPKKDGVAIKPVGDAYGNPAKTRWRARVRKDNAKCGPAFWRHDYLTCPDCHVPDGVKPHLQKTADRSCCDDAPMLGNGTQAYCKPLNMGGKCEVFRFSKDPEVAINAEVGLVLNFEVDEDGYPKGCDDFGKFNYAGVMEDMGKNDHAVPNCPPQMLAEPVTAKPVSQYVQDYADDRTLWLSDFAAVLDIMLSNGYETGSLTESPEASLNCETPKVLPIFPKGTLQTLDQRCPQWSCSEFGEEKAPGKEDFFQLSPWKPGTVLAIGLEGTPQLESVNSVCTSSQQWTMKGDQIVNAKTGQPLLVHGISAWGMVPHATKENSFFIKMAGTKSKKHYLRVGKGQKLEVKKKYEWVVTMI